MNFTLVFVSYWFIDPISDLVAFKANVNELVGLAPIKQGLDKKFHYELNCKACRFELDSPRERSQLAKMF